VSGDGVRGGPKSGQWWAIALAALLAVAGIAHFVAPDGFDAIVPHLLPGSPGDWTRVSGAVELILAIGLLWPTTRRVTATLTAIFFVLVFPANVQMAVDWASRSAPELAIAILRLPLQILLVGWAWHVRRISPPARRTVSATPGPAPRCGAPESRQ
jgi:uncharacterized membrane protein